MYYRRGGSTFPSRSGKPWHPPLEILKNIINSRAENPSDFQRRTYARLHHATAALPAAMVNKGISASPMTPLSCPWIFRKLKPRKIKPHVLSEWECRQARLYVALARATYRFVASNNFWFFCSVKNGFDPSGYGRVRAREINLNGWEKTPDAPDQIPGP
jgi:hypothetical protein